ncbi:MAG: DUF4389 domain-containing protein [Actinomycetota bacterium]|nr:DUF4389 domain-containing protein [Actinomycetota bacterium]
MDHLSVAPEKPAQLFRRAPLTPADQLRTLNYDDLERRRVTVFFRFFMVIPHLLWLSIWAQGMLLLAPVLWVAALVKGRPPEGLRDVYVMFVRYTLHVYAFWFLAAERFPGFLGKPRTYAIDLEVPPPGDQSRWSIGFRGILALPPLMLAGALAGGGGASLATYGASFGVAVSAAFLAWWAAMFKKRTPEGLRDLMVWSLGYAAQSYGYFFLLTGRYPNSDPAVAPLAQLPAHPVRLELTDELRRNRWLVAFRFVLAFPHQMWWFLWTVVAILAAFAGWLCALVLGRLPRPLHRFLAAYVRYGAHFNAFYYLGGGLFPGFLGRAGTYPVDIAIDPPERQGRWTVAFRIVLVFPAFLVAGALSGVMTFAALGGWFYALIRGRMPEGLRNTIAFSVRYVAQTLAYLVLVTPRYPYSGPADFRR